MDGGKDMVAILFAVEQQSRDWIHDVARLLEKHFITLRAFGDTLSVKKRTPSLILCDMNRFETIKAEKAIVICKDMVSLSNRQLDIRHGVAVVDSSIYQSESLPDIGLPAITCGLHSRDTITLTSIEEDSAVIGVQRVIEAFEGSLVEPQEIPVRFEKAIAPFTLMVVAAIYILLGKCNLLKGKL